LAYLKDEPKLLDKLLKKQASREDEMELIFFPEDMPDNGDEPDPELAIACGFEVERTRVGWINRQKEVWTERLLVVRSFNYVQTMQAGLHRRLDKAEKALRALTPQPGRGKQQVKDQDSFDAAVARIEKKYRVAGLFDIKHEKEVTERKIRKYKEKPARVERKVRFQLLLKRNQEAIAQAEFNLYSALLKRDQPMYVGVVLLFVAYMWVWNWSNSEQDGRNAV